MLLVEDQEDTRFTLKTLLDRRGIGVSEAEDGKAVVDVALRERPDLVLLDLSLPRLDGIATMRGNMTLCRVPVVLFLAGVTPSPPFAPRRSTPGATITSLSP